MHRIVDFLLFVLLGTPFQNFSYLYNDTDLPSPSLTVIERGRQASRFFLHFFLWTDHSPLTGGAYDATGRPGGPPRGLGDP